MRNGKANFSLVSYLTCELIWPCYLDQSSPHRQPAMSEAYFPPLSVLLLYLSSNISKCYVML